MFLLLLFLLIHTKPLKVNSYKINGENPQGTKAENAVFNTRLL